MKNASFRQKLLTSFLAIGILPLLICTLLMLNIFRLSLTRSAADAAETQLDAMSGELSGLLSDCETVMEKLCAEPAVAAALDRSELDEQRVYSVLYRAAAPVLGGASLSVYGADGRQLYSTSSQPASGSLSPRWGLLAAAADTNARQVVLAGGVAANGRLRQLVNDGAQKLGAKIFLPELKYCGDNGAMIAAQGYYEFQDGNLADWSLNGLPTLPIDYR